MKQYRDYQKDDFDFERKKKGNQKRVRKYQEDDFRFDKRNKKKR